MDPFHTLMMSVLVLSLTYSLEEGEMCNSPQYIEVEKPGIVICSLENAYAVSWYNSTILRNEYPIVHYSASAKSGRGYISGEFDITRNGSLLINTVSFSHDHYFAVEYLNAKLDDAVVLNIQVIVVVKPHFPFPVIEYCENITGLCFQKVEDPHVYCSVKNIRPAALLELTVKTVNGNKNVSFHRHTESNGKLFTSRVTTRDAFKYTSRLALIACSAHTLPGILERNEYIVLIQNINHSAPSVEPTVRFVERNSSLELRCLGTDIGFLVWWMADTLNSKQLGHLLAYSVMLGNPQKEIHIQGYQMGREGSVIIPQFDITYEGTYSCISSDGLSDTLAVYETIMFVKPSPNYLTVDGCDHEGYCVLDVTNEGNLTCRVNGVRPRVQLQWKASHGTKTMSFKTQEVLIVDKNDTYDVSLTSAYYAQVEPGDRVTVVCEVVGPYTDHFNMTTSIDLNFRKEMAISPSTEATPSPKSRFSTIGVVVPVLMIAVVLCTTASVIRTVYRRKQQKLTQRIDGKETFSLLSVKASQGEVLNDIKQQLIIYLKDRNKSLRYKVENLEDTSVEELLEVLRQLCFRGIEIRGDENLQESALKLLKIASYKKINIRKVLLRDCFDFVGNHGSSIITTSGHVLPRTIPFSQLDITSSRHNLEERDYYRVKQTLCYASQCRKLRLLTFSHCVLPYSFDDSPNLVQLQNKNVEVCWENGIFLPKFVLNLSSGKWQYAVDGCELQHGDYLNLISSISEEESLTVHSKILKRTRNYSPKQMVLARRIFHTMERCFKLHGAVTIDTPMFEMREAIVETFGPHYARAMFDINDQGDESVSLRFDLTIPFVRYITLNNMSELKRYHIGKVCRRDNLFKKG
ncbi:Histidine--tRNA ligase, cytoplasmic [Holothuria leucospilota]|uniref:Histidine--tRNA ligase, cytoplasmic n=1 Tax=Holothuria leucospilota TaxID=206669 RepID=A0A9Q1CTC3_HOLLE|nr:Histidine--tRNA ligase, cytoplasmic [Holothuria leucospilota]